MSTFSTPFARTDTVPEVFLKGVDEQQDVFIYNAPSSVNGEVALYFPLEAYYPDFELAQPVNQDLMFEAVMAYQKIRQNLREMGLGDIDPNSKEAIAYDEVVAQNRFSNYFNTTRALLARLLNNVPPEDVFDDEAPSQDNEEEWADYKAAYFDATGLALIADQIDMPRMAVRSNVFRAFRRSASPEQIRTMDLIEEPSLFDGAGNYRDVA